MPDPRLIAGDTVRHPAIPLRHVAIVQAEKELLHNPQFDLSALPLRQLGIAADLMTDASLVAVDNLDQYDAVVFGEDAIHESAAIMAWLDRRGAPSNAVVLFQSNHDAYRAFLDGVELEPALPRAGAVIETATLGAANEQLLQWPFAVSVGSRLAEHETGTPFSSVRSASPEKWTSVLGLNDSDHPSSVVIRSLGDARTVLCTCLLFPSRPADRQFLCNAIVYAAFGAPRVAIAETADTPRAVMLQKLVLQGKGAVVSRVEGDAASPDFGAWPFAGSSVVIQSRPGVPEDAPAQVWLRRGGVLVTAADGELRSWVGASDADQLGRDWAAWLHSVDPASWAGGPANSGEPRRGKIYATRAILRTLVRLHAIPGLGELLAIPEPTTLAGRIDIGLRSRIDPGGNHVDGLVATTCALLEIDKLVGGAFDRAKVRGMQNWVLGQVSAAVPLDAIDAARVLFRPELLMDMQGRLQGSVSPELLARLRIARAELGIPAPSHESMFAAGPLRGNLLLACEVLLGWSLDVATAEPAVAAGRSWEIEEAVSILARHGLDGMRSGATSNAEALAAEVEARLAFDQLDPLPVRSVAPPGNDQTVSVGAVMAEAARVRSALESTRKRLAVSEDALTTARTSVSVASGLLSGAWAIACIAGGLSVLGVGDTELLTFSVPLAGVALIVGLGVLNRFGLAAQWARELGMALSDGVSGALSWLGRKAGNPTSGAGPRSGDADGA